MREININCMQYSQYNDIKMSDDVLYFMLPDPTWPVNLSADQS